VDATVLAMAAFAFLLAGCVKGVIGLGLPLTAVAILGVVLELREAIPLLVIPVLVTNAWQVLQGGRLAELFRRFWSMNLLLAVGTWLGTVILFRVDPAPLAVLLGVVICAYTLINFFAIRLRVRDGTERFWSPVVGFVSGVLTGTTGSVGAPVAIYLQALRLDKDAFVQAVALSFLIAVVFWIPALIDQGAIDLQTAAWSTAALVPSAIGMWAGRRLRGRLSQEIFSKGVFAFLLVIGISLIRKGLV
jgi:uncharacterized membrane protein YfcA